MEIETILKAMEKAHLQAILITKQPQRMRRYRQFYAFRNHILKRFEKMGFELAFWKNAADVFAKKYEVVRSLLDPDVEENDWKDAEIERLEDVVWKLDKLAGAKDARIKELEKE